MGFKLLALAMSHPFWMVYMTMRIIVSIMSAHPWVCLSKSLVISQACHGTDIPSVYVESRIIEL